MTVEGVNFADFFEMKPFMYIPYSKLEHIHYICKRYTSTNKNLLTANY